MSTINRNTIHRIIMYNRILKEAQRNKIDFITSKEISDILIKNPAQIRKDLSYINIKGKPGVGYNVISLVSKLDSLLGLNKMWNVMLIGAGNLGGALFFYHGFKREGFEFKAVIDNDSGKIGKKWNGIVISSVKNIKNKIRDNKISIAIIAIPRDAAQKIVDKLIDAGIREILSFAPEPLNVPAGVNVRYVDLALELENLSCHLSYKK